MGNTQLRKKVNIKPRYLMIQFLLLTSLTSTKKSDDWKDEGKQDQVHPSIDTLIDYEFRFVRSFQSHIFY